MQSGQTNLLVRKQFLISPRQIDKLDRLAKKKGASVAEMVRQAIDAYDPEATISDAAELIELLSARMKEAIADTQRTRERLNNTLKQLERGGR